MTASERHGLRDRIVSYMEYHPLRMPLSPHRAAPFGHVARGVIAFWLSRMVRIRPLAATVVLAMVVIVPFAAEGSLPGDVLYPVKVRFNEGVRAQLLFSPYEKMVWETKRVERRVAEARLLAKKGRLTEETENTLEETVRVHTTAFQEQLAELRENDASGVAVAEVTFESALDVQSAVLNTDMVQTGSSTDAGAGDVSGLAAIVQEARDTVASTTDSMGGAVSYGPLAARVEENTTRIHALSVSLAGVLTEAQKAEIQERTARLEDDMKEVKAAHASAQNTKAIKILRDALATTEKLIAFMSDIDLRASVSLDTLVPQVVLENTTSVGGVTEDSVEGESRIDEKTGAEGETVLPEETETNNSTTSEAGH